MKPHEIWTEQCEAARGIEDEFGTQDALSYLISEKFLNFLEVADDDPKFRAEIPAFVAEIKTIFEQWQLVGALFTARWTDSGGWTVHYEEGIEILEMPSPADTGRSGADQLLVKKAEKWLLEEENG